MTGKHYCSNIVFHSESGAEPIFHMAKVIHSVFTWKSPLITAVCFMVSFIPKSVHTFYFCFSA